MSYATEEKKEDRVYCVRMFDPINQLFLTLVKLKLNVKLKDLAFLLWDYATCSITVH